MAAPVAGRGAQRPRTSKNCDARLVQRDRDGSRKIDSGGGPPARLQRRCIHSCAGGKHLSIRQEVVELGVQGETPPRADKVVA